MDKPKTPLCFLGFGAWGGAVAIHLARHDAAASIVAWEHIQQLREHIQETGKHPFLGSDAFIPPSIQIVDRLEELPLTSQSILTIAVSSAYVEQTLKKIARIAKPSICLIVSKGLNPSNLSLLSETVQSILKVGPGSIFTLGGPTIAKELLQGAPTVAVLAGPAGDKRTLLKNLLEHGNLELRLSTDLTGVQIGSSMKNIYAIGYGMLDGINAPANTKAKYFIKVMEEMLSVAQKLGGEKDTIYGPAGLGDLLTTSLSVNSRNSRLGRLLAQGKTLQEAQKEIGMVIEGIDACKHYQRLAKRLGLHLEIVSKISAALTRPFKGSEILISFD